MKVWTPEKLSDEETRMYLGYPKTLDISKQDADLLFIDETEYYSTVYVDNESSICRNTSGWDFVACQEHVKDGVLYRCFFCHHKEQAEYCKAINSSGRRCTQLAEGEEQFPRKYFRSDKADYCSRHLEYADKYKLPYSLDDLDEYLEKWQMESVYQFKRQFIERLKSLGELTYELIFAVKDSLREVPSAPLGSKERKQLKLKLAADTEYTYFILCDGYVKIGKSVNPFIRFETLIKDGDPTIRPDGIDMTNARLIGYVVGGSRLESALHYMFTEQRVAGEWFHYESKIAKTIDMLIDSSDQTIEWLLEDMAKNYDVLISTDTHGGYDIVETEKSLEKKSSVRHLMHRNEEERKLEYGF